MMQDHIWSNNYSLTLQAVDMILATQMAKYWPMVYASVFKCSSMAWTSNELGPDVVDDSYNLDPNKVDQLFKRRPSTTGSATT